jgi:hypothetical protein
MNFDVAGPFEVPRFGQKKLITKKSGRLLREHLENWEEGLSEAPGCYVFVTHAGRGYTPHYVGQARKRAMLSEAMNASNIGKYNEVLDRRGTPMLFFVPFRTPGGKFRKRQKVDGGIPALDFLERWLITTALQKNPKLVNNKETYFLKNIHVTGVLNSGRGVSTSASRKLTLALY